VELSEKKVVVDEKTKTVEALIEVIRGKTEVAGVRQEEAAKKQDAAALQAIEINREKEVADAALQEAMPAVEAAAAALENLDKADLQELKAFANPAQAIMNVCYMLIHLNPTNDKNLQENWIDAKKVLGNPNLLTLLKTYPKDKITEKQIKKVKVFFKDPSVNVESMANISKAGKGLLVWVTAICKYYDVARNVEPLRIKVGRGFLSLELR
jgi:dynein heavy chain, axonemal